MSKNRELKAVKDVLQGTEREYRSRVSRLKSKFKTLRSRHRRLRKRRNLELTGYRTDILSLKKDVAELRDMWVRRETKRLYGRRTRGEIGDGDDEGSNYGADLDALNSRLAEIEKSYGYDSVGEESDD